MDVFSIASEHIEIINDNTYTDSTYYSNIVHSDVNGNICSLIARNLVDKDCRVYLGNMELYTDLVNAKSDGEHVAPDIMVISDREFCLSGRRLFPNRQKV